MTEHTTISTLPLLKCVVDANDSITVQTQITTSLTQLETHAPPTSLQMTATDNSTHRVSQLKNFAVLVMVVVFNGFVARFQLPLLLSVSIRLPTKIHPVLNTLKTHRRAECTCFITHLSSRFPTQSIFFKLKTKQVRHPCLQLIKSVLCVWWG